MVLAREGIVSLAKYFEAEFWKANWASLPSGLEGIGVPRPAADSNCPSSERVEAIVEAMRNPSRIEIEKTVHQLEALTNMS